MADSATTPSSAQGTVLVVEDENAIRMLIEVLVDSLALKARCVANGEEALSALQEGLEPVLLITDMLMPGMTGSDLTKQVLARKPELPILLISAYPKHPSLPEILQLSKNIVFLEKPFDTSVFLDTVTNILGL